MGRSQALGVVAVLACLFLTPTSARAELSASVVHSGLLHELTVDAPVYVMQDSVVIDYAVTNQSAGSIWLEFRCWAVSLFIKVLDPNDEVVWMFPAGCLDSIWWDEFTIGESYSEHRPWDMVDMYTFEPISEPGVYTIQGALATETEPYFHVLSVEVTIVDAETVVPGQLESTWSVIKALYQ